MTYQQPLPDTNDPATAPFWRGLRDRKLRVQRCRNCHAPRFPAAPLCPQCLTPGGEWSEIKDTGTLWSYVIYRRALAPAFGDVPYAVGVVELESRLHVLARISAPLDSITIGDLMKADYHDVSDDVTLLRWVPLAGAETGRG